jgi:hypothetical protein
MKTRPITVVETHAFALGSEDLERGGASRTD